MTERDKRWIEIQFIVLIRNVWDAMKDLDTVNQFINVLFTVNSVQNRERIMIYANAVLRNETLVFNILEAIELAYEHGIVQKAIADWLKTTQPYISMLLKTKCKCVVIQKPTLNDEEIQDLQNFIDAWKYLQRSLLYVGYCSNDKRISVVREDGTYNGSVRLGDDYSKLYY